MSELKKAEPEWQSYDDYKHKGKKCEHFIKVAEIQPRNGGFAERKQER